MLNLKSEDDTNRFYLFFRGFVYGTLFLGVMTVLIPWFLLMIEKKLNLDYKSGILLKIAGISVGFTGLCISVSCVYYFIRRGLGTPAPFDEPQKLISSGPYKFSRNPMQTGNILIILGITLYFSSPIVLGYLVLYWLFYHLFAIFYEEPHLRDKYGDEYIRYRERVNRWFPGIF